MKDRGREEKRFRTGETGRGARRRGFIFSPERLLLVLGFNFFVLQPGLLVCLFDKFLFRGYRNYNDRL